jgi:tripartite-type tricarboxylate transporter receptor subunit TctC
VSGQDASIVTSTPEELSRKIAAESKRYGDIVTRLGSQIR